MVRQCSGSLSLLPAKFSIRLRPPRASTTVLGMGILIAGGNVPSPRPHVRNYILNHKRTITQYDLAPTPRTLTKQLVANTRVIASRITRPEENWIVSLKPQVDAPLAMIPSGATLSDADPTTRGGIYDHMESSWRILCGPRKGFSVAKTSKVLHALRPELFPILDSHLMKLYRGEARSEASRLRAADPVHFRDKRYAFWSAVRNDLIANQDELVALRRTLSADPDSFVRQTAVQLSRLRLLDILAW